jgi:hypothetical protein
MRILLVVTAASEAATGLALLLLPSMVVSLLLGAILDTPSGPVVARVAGAALLALGTACWLARNDQQSTAAKGLIAALLLYNAATVAVLIFAAYGLAMSGIGLWPAIVAHVALAAWCVACLPMNK